MFNRILGHFVASAGRPRDTQSAGVVDTVSRRAFALGTALATLGMPEPLRAREIGALVPAYCTGPFGGGPCSPSCCDDWEGCGPECAPYIGNGGCPSSGNCWCDSTGICCDCWEVINDTQHVMCWCQSSFTC